MIKICQNNEKLFIKALEIADKYNLLEDIKGEFWSCLTESSWSGAIGCVPTHLVEAQTRITTMIKQTVQPRVINFLENVLEGLMQQADWHLRHDQDLIANN